MFFSTWETCIWSFPALNLSTLNVGILILMQQVRLIDKILVSAQGLLVFGLGAKGLGPWLDNKNIFIFPLILQAKSKVHTYLHVVQHRHDHLGNVHVVDCHYLSDFLCCEYSSCLVPRAITSCSLPCCYVSCPPISFSIVKDTGEVIILIEGEFKIDHFVSQPCS